MLSLALVVIGLIVLTVGAEALVRGASRLAVSTGLSSLVIGLTIVAYGTSMPEMTVSTIAALNEQPDVAVGNVVGSNIFNVLFILGVSALIVPLRVSTQLIRLDVPIMIGASILALLFCLDGSISHIESVVFVVGIVSYTVFIIWYSRRNPNITDDSDVIVVEPTPRGWLKNIALILIGLVGLIAGAKWFVDGAIVIAREMGVSELIIGLTLVAIGTSMPELATSVVASLRGERDIAVGNVVGSNIFNILGVLGISGVVSSNGIPVSPQVLSFDLPVMIAVAVVCLPVFYTGFTIARWEGAVFLGYYGAYTVYLFLSSTNHMAFGTFDQAMKWLVLPATALILTISMIQMIRSKQTQSLP